MLGARHVYLVIGETSMAQALPQIAISLPPHPRRRTAFATTAANGVSRPQRRGIPAAKKNFA
jgi:hypothetical protein